MRTIALETSWQPGELAVVDGDRIHCVTSLPEDRRTTETFAATIQRSLKSIGWRPQDVELFAICEGPGSFTGLRIGVTAAKLFSYATGCQVAAVNTLRLLGEQAGVNEPVWSVLDAQRKQLFVAQFQRLDGRFCEQSPTQVVGAQDWLAQRKPGTWVTGAGLSRWRSAIPAHVQLTPESCWRVQATQLASTAHELVNEQGGADIWKLAPRYYRRSAAEEKLG